jgi:hypothetical protein
MRHGLTLGLALSCFGALFFTCYAPALFRDGQFSYRDAGHYYYPLNQRVQAEWNQGRWPLWEPEENAGMPLLGNPTAAVLYPGKIVFAILPYAWGARAYIVGHSALAFLAMLVLMRSWGTSGFGSALSALSYAFGAPVLFQYSNIIYLIGAAWLPLGMHAADQWVRLGRRWGLIALAIVLSMQVLGGDPQAAYLLGVASIGYAAGLAWARARSTDEALADEDHSRTRSWLFLAVVAIALVLWCVATLALAQWLPRLRDPGKPPPPLRWMAWVPLVVALAWALVALGLLVRWRARGGRSPLAVTCGGLAAAAVLAAALTAAQLLPVIEFIQLTGRARAGPRDTSWFSLEPFRVVELAWPNVLGVSLEGKSYWRDLIQFPGGRPLGWVPSLYLGGLTLALALSALTVRRGPPWRVWLTGIAWISLLASLGQYTSPIWMARAGAVASGSTLARRWLADLGPIDSDMAPIRLDGYLRDGDGGFYWWLTTLLPGFRQFRFPAKLFTLTTLALAGLAGLGWDRLTSARARRTTAIFSALLAVTLVVLIGVGSRRETILASFRTLSGPSMFGPFEPEAGYQAVIHSLGHAAIVFGLGLLVTVLARKYPRLAGAAAIVIVTVDLAAANARLVLTCPQSLMETKPEALQAIEDAERADPSPGPFRIHRMAQWFPPHWSDTPSNDRMAEIIAWERDTLNPKYGINHGLEYTHTLGVAQLDDYDQFFPSFFYTLLDKPFAQNLGVAVGENVLYHPRRAYDLWNTRYMVVPYDPNGWRDPLRGFASFLFRSRQVYPERDRTRSPEGRDLSKTWADTRDFKVIRNLIEYPRAWVVHAARATVPAAATAAGAQSETVQELIYARDPIWKNDGLRAFDPRTVAWLSRTDLVEIGRALSGRPPGLSETVTVTYPNPQQVVLEAKLESPGLVVLADVYYPGWQLTIDGAPAPIYRVNSMMRGAAVRSGPHRLVYTYSPRSFRVGRIVSMAGLVALLVLVVVCVKWPIDPAIAAFDGALFLNLPQRGSTNQPRASPWGDWATPQPAAGPERAEQGDAL